MSVPPPGGFGIVTGPYRYRATRRIERPTQTIDRM
jgi:hypothetical protein